MSSVSFGDTMAPTIEKAYILFLGYRILFKVIHSWKLTWKPKRVPVKTTALLNWGYMDFHVSLGECKGSRLEISFGEATLYLWVEVPLTRYVGPQDPFCRNHSRPQVDERYRVSKMNANRLPGITRICGPHTTPSCPGNPVGSFFLQTGLSSRASLGAVIAISLRGSLG